MVELIQFKPRIAKWGFKIKGQWTYEPFLNELTDYLNCKSSKETWWVQVEYEDYEYGDRSDEYLYTNGKIYVCDENLALLLKLKNNV